MTLVMQWCDRSTDPHSLAEFFVRHVTLDYVSHVEIQLGRARTDGTWSENLLPLLVEEFSSILSPQETRGNQFRAFSGFENDELVCMGIVAFRGQGGANAFAIIEDFIVHSEKRSAQLGSKALEWIETSIRELGITTLFLETGTANLLAQSFFRRRGFRPTSIVFHKELISRRSEPFTVSDGNNKP